MEKEHIKELGSILLDTNLGEEETWKRMQALEDAGCSMAAIILAYNSDNPETKKHHLQKAVDIDGSTTSLCSLAYIRFFEGDQGDETEQMFYKAAMMSHPSALLALTRFCMDRGAVVEAAYWAFMAERYEHPLALPVMRECTIEWTKQGYPREFRESKYPHFTEEHHQATIEMMMHLLEQKEIDDVVKNLEGNQSDIAIFLKGFREESSKNFAKAEEIYKLLSEKDSALGFRLYGNLVAFDGEYPIEDKDVYVINDSKKIAKAIPFHQKATKLGDNVAMHNWGMFEMEQGEKELGAVLVTMSKIRGYEPKEIEE